jgi:hypothetical protein
MNNQDDMKYVEKFEDEGFVYELNVEAVSQSSSHLYTISQGSGYQCRWDIAQKDKEHHNIVSVTDDQCEVIIFDSVESAIKGAKAFLSIQA